MFKKMRQAWAESQERLNQRGILKTLNLVNDCANEVLAGANPETLYGNPVAGRMRVAFRQVRAHSKMSLDDVVAKYKSSDFWKELSAPQQQAVESVFGHLRDAEDSGWLDG